MSWLWECPRCKAFSDIPLCTFCAADDLAEELKMVENMDKNPAQNKLNEALNFSEEEVEKTLQLLEQFAQSIGKSKLKEKVIISLFAKHLKLNQRDLQKIIDACKSGKLRRELMK